MKRFFYLLLCIAAVGILVGCGASDDKAEDSSEFSAEAGENSESIDFVEEYISSLPSNKAREDFLSFWNEMQSYCRKIEIELKEIENTEVYTFNPMDEETIPQKISELYDFQELRFFKGYDTHENYEMTVSGKSVTLSFDGHVFYPIESGYTEIKEYVEKYNEQ